MIFQVVVIQRAKQGFGARHLLWLRCSAEVHLARGHLMHLEWCKHVKSKNHKQHSSHLNALWEESRSIFLFHSRHLDLFKQT